MTEEEIFTQYKIIANALNALAKEDEQIVLMNSTLHNAQEIDGKSHSIAWDFETRNWVISGDVLEG